MAPYPAAGSERTRWTLARRGARNPVQADRPYAFFHEREPADGLDLEAVSAVFLTNRECPWKCAMCDLWQNTSEQVITSEQVVEQIRFALANLPRATVLKLYNSGSFFDRGAIPRASWTAIADICRSFRHLVVECHPRLVDAAVSDFARMLPSSLEVALGLETVDEAALEKLNKRISVSDYRRAAERLLSFGVELRTFLLLHPPFVRKEEQEHWLRQSLDCAFSAGSRVVSLIPLRRGNGAVEALQALGLAELPTLSDLETAQEIGIGMRRGICLADTWDLQLFSRCPACFGQRHDRITRMNLEQTILPPVACSICAG